MTAECHVQSEDEKRAKREMRQRKALNVVESEVLYVKRMTLLRKIMRHMADDGVVTPAQVYG